MSKPFHIYKHTNSTPQAKIFRKWISGCARRTNIIYISTTQQQGSFTADHKIKIRISAFEKKLMIS